MKQRILALLLTLSLLASCLPLPGLAQETEVPVETGNTPLLTEAAEETAAPQESTTPPEETIVPQESTAPPEEEILESGEAETLLSASASGECGIKLTWSLENGVLTISGTGAMTHYSTSANAPWHSYRREITSVIIGEGVTSIGDYAFFECSALTGVSIPGSVTGIGISAFAGCASLKQISLPDSVTYIGGYAFYGCTSLTGIAIPANLRSVSTYAFFNCSQLSSLILPQGSSEICEYAFGNCTSLTAVTLPENLQFLRSNAFQGCTGLRSIDIPAGVGSLGGYAFDQCTSLEQVTLHDGLKYIGSYAFQGCTALTEILLPNTLRTIAQGAFMGCTGLTGISIPASVTTLELFPFQNCTGLTRVTFEQTDPAGSSISMGTDAFKGCTALTDVTLPAVVGGYGINCFNDCTSLTTIVIPASARTIGGFQNCTALRNVILQEGLTTIYDNAFAGCTSLTSLVIPASVTQMGSDLFTDALDTITFKGDAPLFSNIFFTFQDVTATAYYPEDNATWTEEVRQDYGGTITWVPYGEEELQQCGDSLYWELIGEQLTITGTGDMWDFTSSSPAPWASQKDQVIGIILGEGVTSIGSQAFCEMDNLAGIYIPSGVSKIGERAFYGSSRISVIKLPASLTRVEKETFRGCTNLDSIAIPNLVTYIGVGAFAECTDLQKVTFSDSITVIDDYAFQDSAIQGMPQIMPKNLQTIGDYAFYNTKQLFSVVCQENLTSIGAEAFGETAAAAVFFYGDAPQIAANAFASAKLTAYYRKDLTSWNTTVFQDYGGKIIWYAFDPENPLEVFLRFREESGKQYLDLTLNSAGSLDPLQNLNVKLTVPAAIQILSGETAFTIEEVPPLTEATYSWEVSVPKLAYPARYTCMISITCADLPAQILQQDTISIAGTAPVNYTYHYGIDNFSFTNATSSNGFSKTNEPYYVSDADLAALLSHLTNTEIVYLARENAINKSVENLINNRLRNWEGSCFGISLVSIALRTGLLTLADLPGRGGATTPFQLKVDKNANSALESFINVYQLTSSFRLYQCEESGTSDFPATARELWAKACAIGTDKDENSPFIVRVASPGGGHAVVCYGAETGEYPGGYTRRLNIYDCAVSWNIESDSAEQSIYISDDYTKAKYSKDVAGYEVTIFGYFCESENELLQYDFRDMKKNYQISVSLAAMPKFTVVSHTGKTLRIENGEIVSGDMEAELYYPTESIDGTSDFFRITLSEKDGPYTIHSDTGEVDALFLFEDRSASLTGSASSAVFQEDGTILAVDPAGPISMTLASDESAFDFITVTGTPAQDFSLSANGDSIVTSGSLLDGTLTHTNREGESDTLTLPETEDELEILYTEGSLRGVCAKHTPDAQDPDTCAVCGTSLSESLVRFTQASVSLSGDIGLNYYVSLSPDLVSDPGTYLQFSFGGQTQKIPLSQAVKNSDGTYRFSCVLAARNMADTVTAQVYTSSGAVGASKAYSVREYCTAVIKTYSGSASYAKLVSLLNAMLNYGAQSQRNLNHNVSDLANSLLSAENQVLPAITAADAAPYAAKITGTEDGIKIYSASLLLKTTTTIRVYLQLTGAKTIGQYRILADGKEVTPVHYSGKFYYVDLVGIRARDLDTAYTFQAGGTSLRFSGLGYVSSTLNQATVTADAVNMARALWGYAMAANDYFGS